MGAVSSQGSTPQKWLFMYLGSVTFSYVLPVLSTGFTCDIHILLS